ncbi:hypothetical protein DL771_005365 [Monosporascus sp. 5C6A]|nr:hypothetical protein DL771_005365 [Monosporascus sp. 5C6A]
MSTGGSGADSGRLFNYGASTAGPNVDLTDEQAQGMNAGYVCNPIGKSILIQRLLTHPKQRETGNNSSSGGIMNSVKEALKPGDKKHMGDTSHSGSHGGIMDTMKPGNQERTGGSGGVMDTLKKAVGVGGGNDSSLDETKVPSASGATSGIFGSKDPSHTGTMADPGHAGSALESGSGATGYGSSPGGLNQNRLGARTAENYRYDEYASTGSPKGVFGKGSELGDRATPRVSAFDSQGAIGHQFTSEGAIGKVGEKVGGPFSKEGAIGKQFTDSGAIGGAVQDTLGHGNATRQGK